jgi:urease accessory protein
MDNDSYLLLLLSDGNLPTGSFVSSSGLESYFKHGFPAVSGPSNVPANIQATVSFIKQSLAAYAHLALPFAADAHEVATNASTLTEVDTIHQLQELDGRYEAMTLNHITRRASKAQGVALLTLFSKGFSRPTWVDSLVEGEIDLPSQERSAAQAQYRIHEILVDAFKLSIRKGETPGHLPVCWGILTASLLLSKGLSSAHIQPTP